VGAWIETWPCTASSISRCNRPSCRGEELAENGKSFIERIAKSFEQYAYIGKTTKNGATRATLGFNTLEIKQLTVVPSVKMGLL